MDTEYFIHTSVVNKKKRFMSKPFIILLFAGDAIIYLLLLPTQKSRRSLFLC